MKIDNDSEAKEYGIETFPTLIYFEKRIPHIYDGDLHKEEELLKWLIHQKKHSEIPDVTDEMLSRIIENNHYVAVLFCKLPGRATFSSGFADDQIALQTTGTITRT